MKKLFEEAKLELMRLEAIENTTINADDEDPSMGGGSDDDFEW